MLVSSLNDRLSTLCTALPLVRQGGRPAFWAWGEVDTSTLPPPGSELPILSQGRGIKRVVLDLDGTLVMGELMDSLAEHWGIAKQLKPLTEQAMRGEIDFVESFERRTALLTGMPVEDLETVAHRATLTPHIDQIVSKLHRQGIVVDIATGAYSPLASILRDRIGADDLCSSQPELRHGRLTGRLEHTISGQDKAHYLLSRGKALGITPEETLAVGDGANDLPMLAQAGYALLYSASAHSLPLGTTPPRPSLYNLLFP